MEVLITGHKGFVGRHFCEYLGQENITGVDIVDGNDCRTLFENDTRRYDLVIHLAAIVGGRQTIENSPLSVATDLSIDAEFFSWVMRTKPKKVIYFSSSAAYPINLQVVGKYHWLKENDIDLSNIENPDMTYGWAKLTGEFLASFAANESDIWIFRPFSGYGEDQHTDYPFPSFIDRALRREDPFTIWGDGTQVRDFIHIDDIVRACMHIVNHYPPMTVNLGTARPTSFIHLADLIFEELGWEPEIETQPNKPVGVHFRVADVKKMLRYYNPTIPLEEGIRRALCAREQNLDTTTKN